MSVRGKPKIFDDLQQYRKIFDLFDKDGNGAVDVFELVQALTEMGEDYTATEAKKLIKSVDTDHNGELDFDEFCTLILREGWEPPAAEHFLKKAAPRTPKGGKRFSLPSQPKCPKCKKSAYPIESVTVDKITYHKRCFRCKHCDVKLSMKNMAMIHSDAYCKTHFKQLFQQSGGKYDRAFGDQFGTSSDPLARKAHAEKANQKNKAGVNKPVAVAVPAEAKVEPVAIKPVYLQEEEAQPLSFHCNSPCNKKLRNTTVLLAHFRNRHDMEEDKLLELLANGFAAFGDLK